MLIKMLLPRLIAVYFMKSKPVFVAAAGFLLLAGYITACVSTATPGRKPAVALANSLLQLNWAEKEGGWGLARVQVRQGSQWIEVPAPDGEYTLLFSAAKPDQAPAPLLENGRPVAFPEPVYRYNTPVWAELTQPVALNTAGQAYHFYPGSASRTGQGQLLFTQQTPVGQLQARWKLDDKHATDVVVRLTLTASRDGYYSLATPALATAREQDITWGTIPGHFQGREIAASFVHAVAYGQGIPAKPILVRERTATTLSPLLSTRNGVTMAVIPAPGTSRDPWEKDQITQRDWQLGLSLMNRKAQLVPTAYHPVLGEKGSKLSAGDTTSFTFRYTLQAADWFTVYKHAINDIYRFGDFLTLKQTRQSLTDRVLAMHRYAIDDNTSKWRTEEYQGKRLGAQAYLGGVLDSEKDAMKNSDYGAMWMLARIMDDPTLRETRLPYARNFKLLQQEQAPGFFQGAAIGQYYLSQSKKFTEEWGAYVEPIALTYYTMMDIGNILLFEPRDAELRERLRAGAERLLAWQQPAGNWKVAYDRATQREIFTELEDLRPTFYGLVIAYRLLGDKRYLEAARKGADWYVQQAVNKGSFLGVCGDNRFVPDFATGQSAQALLDLYDLTQEPAYLQAAVKATQLYTMSVYTHPVPSREEKMVKGVKRQDWEISQVGLSNEHGGGIGSANYNGPIPLASHAGLFVRMHRLTGENLYLNMARAAALGRDAFVDPKTNVASYYWNAMNNGPGAFPHHAWWQVGWITDYLLAEAELRSAGRVTFPRGFITPKVGPHQAYGFAPGQVFGATAALWLQHGMVKTESPYLDYFGAIDKANKKLYLILLNNDDDALSTRLHLDPQKVLSAKTIKVGRVARIAANGKKEHAQAGLTRLEVDLPAYGLSVVELAYED
jgi:hypothetical protein